MEDQWTYSYINKLQDFVNTINSRTNRVTKIAPNEVTKKDVPHLISLKLEQLQKLVRRPKLYVGDFVRIAKIDLLFEKDTNNHSLTKFLKSSTSQQETH